jgi:PAS domain S-box-containing protein
VLIATDRQVSDYQRLSEAKSDALRWQLWLVFIAGLALLAYSALRVLRPLMCGARRTGRTGILGAALRHAMAENRLILDTTDDGMFGVDQAGRIRFINPAAAQLLGVEADRLAGQAHHPVILADSEDARSAPVSSGANGRKWRPGALPVSRERGSRISPSNTRSSPPRRSGCLCLFRDISARQANEERVQRLRLRLVDAIEAMDDAFALFDADDRISLYNLRFTEFSPFPVNMARSACASRSSSAAWRSRGSTPSRRKTWRPGSASA